MSALAVAFMLVSWSMVIGLTVWSFARVLQGRERAGRQEREDRSER